MTENKRLGKETTCTKCVFRLENNKSYTPSQFEDFALGRARKYTTNKVPFCELDYTQNPSGPIALEKAIKNGARLCSKLRFRNI